MAIAHWALLVATLPYTFGQDNSSTSDDSSYSEEKAQSEKINNDAIKYIGFTWAALVGALLCYRWILYLLRHIRQLTNLYHGSSSDGRQRYFSIPNEKWAWIKRHILSAPLWSRRHNREFQLSSAVNVGTLPSRLQMFFLFGYLGLNVTFVVWDIEWHTSEFYDQGLQRTGILAVLNMIPLFLLAGRNNPLIFFLGISFDTYNLIHRWIGRIAILEAAAHASFWMAHKIAEDGSKGWSIIADAMAHSQMILTGLIGLSAFVTIFFQAPSIVRHAFYETFLHIHIALALTAVGVLWVHLEGLPSQSMLLVALIMWVIERAVRIFWIVLNNCTRKGVTKAEVEALPGEAVRITLHVARPWKFRPGQHIYLYMPSVGLWTSHPFSLAWSEECDGSEKSLPVSRQDMLTTKKTSVSIIVRRRTGFTDKLYMRAEAMDKPFTTNAYVEGPYGNQNFRSYGTVMLFAAGIGITYQVPHVRDLVAGYSNGMCATRKIILVWIIQSPEHLEWIRPWMTQILGMDKRREVLKVLLFVTRPRSTKEIHSPSASVQMFPGKPDVSALIAKEQDQQVGAMAISVCGTGSLSGDVRKATRDRCETTVIDFFEEAFSW